MFEIRGLIKDLNWQLNKLYFNEAFSKILIYMDGC